MKLYGFEIESKRIPFLLAIDTYSFVFYVYIHLISLFYNILDVFEIFVRRILKRSENV